jgi:GNAT superfamily N-acetyltransferase
VATLSGIGFPLETRDGGQAIRGRLVGMMRSLVIRPAVAGDLDAVLELLAQLHPERPELPVADDARGTWARMLAEPNRTVFVARLDGTVCGTADLLVVTNLTHAARPWSIVENVVVDEAHRRRGVGRLLMDVVVRSAREAGAYKVQLLSAEGRDAHHFYEALGFEPRAQGFRLYF